MDVTQGPRAARRRTRFSVVLQWVLVAVVAAYVLGLRGPNDGLVAGLAALVFIGVRFAKWVQVAARISSHIRPSAQAKPGAGSSPRDEAAA